MNIKFKNIFLLILSITLLASCTTPEYIKEIYSTKYKPLNILPMYGAPYRSKTEKQKQTDAKFIRSIMTDMGTREKGAIAFSNYGWVELKKGNEENAMRRFNQSWLLNPEYYQPYWGFGFIVKKSNMKKASTFLEKSIKLVDNEIDKAKILTQLGELYSLQSFVSKKSDPIASKELYKKSTLAIDSALKSNPKYGGAYKRGAIDAYAEGDYERVWGIIRKAREHKSYKFSPKFITALTKKMPEQ